MRNNSKHYWLLVIASLYREAIKRAISYTLPIREHMKLDSSQRAIINAAVARHTLTPEQRTPESSVINVQAVAGAGKSVVITELTRRLSSASFLFLCFSTSIADRARATLPASVHVATFDEAARAFVQRTHPMKIGRTDKLPRVLPDRAIHQATELKASTQETRIIRRVLHFFYRSASASIEHDLVEEALTSMRITKPGLATHILQMARMVWSSQTRRSDSSAPICQGAMIKLWTQGRQEVRYSSKKQRSGHPYSNDVEMIAPLGGAEMIAVEEAQDLTEAMIGFLGRQNRVVLMFGDAMQTLLKRAPAAHQDHALQQRGYRVSLAQTYRFGQDVAGLLTLLKDRCHDAQQEPIVGRPGFTSGIGVYHPEALHRWVDQRSPITLLGASIIDMLPLLMNYPDTPVGWVDGLANPGYHYQTLWDMACLTAPQEHPIRKRIQNRWIREARTLEQLHEQLTQRQAQLSVQLCEWVQANRHAPLLKILETLRQREACYQHAMVNDLVHVPAPGFTFATPTTAKGHEWPTVAICPSLTRALHYLPKDGVPNESLQRMLRSLYTAVSRVQHTLLVPEDLVKLAQQGNSGVTVTPIEQLACVTHSEQDHPYFGIARHRVLEMNSDSRLARRHRYQRQQNELRQLKAKQRQPENKARDATLAREQLAAMKSMIRS